MFWTIQRIVWNTFSESDNKYLDLARIGYAVTLLAALAFQGWSVYEKPESFSMVDFGTGITLILFGGGAGIGIRAKLEDGTPKAKETNPDVPAS
jgi:hypothetical protein